MIERITTNEEYFAALARIEQLGPANGTETDAELELLANLVESYEDRHPEVVFNPDVPTRRVFT